MGDWVKNHRKIVNWKFYKKEGYAHLWQHLIRKAQFKDRYNSNGQFIKRGQVDYSIRQLASETGLNRSKVQRILNALSTEQQIETVHKGRNPKDLSIISIPSYDEHQNEDEKRDGLRDSSETVARRQRDNFKKVKKEKNDKNIYIPQVELIIGHLNKKTGASFKCTAMANKEIIKSRLKEGYTTQDLLKVIDNKCSDWLGSEKMEKFLRPSTLFQPSKIEGYLNERQVQTVDKGKIYSAVKGLVDYNSLGKTEQDFIRGHGGLNAMNNMGDYAIKKDIGAFMTEEEKNYSDEMEGIKEKEHQRQRDAENQHHLKLREKFIQTYDTETLVKYVAKWFIGVYGRSAYNDLDGVNLKLSLWEKSALLDLESANYNSDNAIKIGRGETLT